MQNGTSFYVVIFCSLVVVHLLSGENEPAAAKHELSEKGKKNKKNKKTKLEPRSVAT